VANARPQLFDFFVHGPGWAFPPFGRSSLQTTFAESFRPPHDASWLAYWGRFFRVSPRLGFVWVASGSARFIEGAARPLSCVGAPSGKLEGFAPPKDGYDPAHNLCQRKLATCALFHFSPALPALSPPLKRSFFCPFRLFFFFFRRLHASNGCWLFPSRWFALVVLPLVVGESSRPIFHGNASVGAYLVLAR